MTPPFTPAVGQTVNIDVAATSAAIQINAAGTSGMSQVRVMNNGSATAWIRFGTSSPTAVATTDIPIGSGACEVFTVQNPAWVAAIAAGATGKIYFTPGQGI